MSNGNIIGIKNLPNSETASGIWSLREQLKSKSDNKWPHTPQLLSVTRTHNAATGVNNVQTHSFTGVNLGAVPLVGQKRYIVIALNSQDDNSSYNHTEYTNAAVTLDGNTLTYLTSAYSTPSQTYLVETGLWMIEENTLTSSTLSITWTTDAHYFAGIVVYSVIVKDATLALHSSSSAADSLTLNTNTSTEASNSFVIGVAQGWNTSVPVLTPFDDVISQDGGTTEYMASGLTILDGETSYSCSSTVTAMNGHVLLLASFVVN